MSCHVVFLEYIHFFSISFTTHSLIRFNLIRIYLFSEDSYNLSSQVPSTSNPPFHILTLLPLHLTRPIRTNHYAGTDTLLSGTPETLFSSMVLQALFDIVDPPLRQSICIRKSIKLLDFFYCYYSLSFTSFLAFIHYLSKPFFL